MGRRWPSPITQTIIEPSELSQKIPGAAKIEKRITNSANSTSPSYSVNNTNEEMTQRRPLTTDVPFYPCPTYRPLPKPIRCPMEGSHEGSQSSNSAESTDIDSEINIDFEENSPLWEGFIQKPIRDPINLSFKIPRIAKLSKYR